MHIRLILDESKHQISFLGGTFRGQQEFAQRVVLSDWYSRTSRLTYIRRGDQQTVEYSSSSALLYLSHWLYLCTYHDNVYIIFDISNRSLSWSGVSVFLIMRGCTEWFCLKRPPVYPLTFVFYISLGALVVSEPTRHPLIGDSHQIIWGHGQVWTSHASWSA